MVHSNCHSLCSIVVVLQIIELSCLQKWTKLPRNDDDPWPEKRASAAACCLNFGQRNPQLLVTGGVNAQRKPLGDAWVLDIEKGNWRKVGSLYTN